MNQIVGLGVVALACAAVFWGARAVAGRLNDAQRKLVLYLLPFGGTAGLLLAFKSMNEAVLMMSGVALIVAFFGMLTAPEKV